MYIVYYSIDMCVFYGDFVEMNRMDSIGCFVVFIEIGKSFDFGGSNRDVKLFVCVEFVVDIGIISLCFGYDFVEFRGGYDFWFRFWLNFGGVNGEEVVEIVSGDGGNFGFEVGVGVELVDG